MISESVMALQVATFSGELRVSDSAQLAANIDFEMLQSAQLTVQVSQPLADPVSVSFNSPRVFLLVICSF